MKAESSFKTPLTLRKSCLAPASEWAPQWWRWTMIQVIAGSGYWISSRRLDNGAPGSTLNGPMSPMFSQRSCELETGTVVLASACARGHIRASQLGELVFQYFGVDPDRLSGLLTLSDLQFFEAAEGKDEFLVQIFPSQSPIATNMRELGATANCEAASFRLQLVQLFLEIFAKEMKSIIRVPPSPVNAKTRIAELLRATPAADLLHMNISELARMTGCTVRHFNRIFSEIVGTSFREKHVELRLARACELLAGTESKVVDVALESGYQSLSLFHLMFNRRFGVSPGKWRKLNGGYRKADSQRNTQTPRISCRRNASLQVLAARPQPSPIGHRAHQSSGALATAHEQLREMKTPA